MSSAIPRRQKFAKWPPRVRPQRILPERANAELHCLEVLASAPFVEGLQWNPQPSLFLGPSRNCFLHGPPVSSESALHLFLPWARCIGPLEIGWLDKGQQGRQCIVEEGRERGRAALKTICAKTQKPQTSDGRMTAQSRTYPSRSLGTAFRPIYPMLQIR